MSDNAIPILETISLKEFEKSDCFNTVLLLSYVEDRGFINWFLELSTLPSTMLSSQPGGTCLVPPDLYEFGPTKTCEIGPTGFLKNVLFSKTSEFGPTDFFLDPNLLPLSIYWASL